MGAINLEQWTSIPRWFLDALQLPISAHQLYPCSRLVARVIIRAKRRAELIDLFCTASKRYSSIREMFNFKAFATNCGSSGMFLFSWLFQPADVHVPVGETETVISFHTGRPQHHPPQPNRGCTRSNEMRVTHLRVSRFGKWRLCHAVALYTTRYTAL